MQSTQILYFDIEYISVYIFTIMKYTDSKIDLRVGWWVAVVKRNP